MEELKNELAEVFRLLSVIPVSGDNVEVMAAVKERLRKAYKLAISENGGENINGG